MPQPPGENPAAYGAEAPTGAVGPRSETPTRNSSTRPRRVAPKRELEFKRDRIQKERAATEKRQADREAAARMAAEAAQQAPETVAALPPSEGAASDEPAENAAMLQESAREAECSAWIASGKPLPGRLPGQSATANGGSLPKRIRSTFRRRPASAWPRWRNGARSRNGAKNSRRGSRQYDPS